MSRGGPLSPWPPLAGCSVYCSRRHGRPCHRLVRDAVADVLGVVPVGETARDGGKALRSGTSELVCSMAKLSPDRVSSSSLAFLSFMATTPSPRPRWPWRGSLWHMASFSCWSPKGEEASSQLLRSLIFCFGGGFLIIVIGPKTIF